MDFVDINVYSDDEEVPVRKQRVLRERINHFEKWDRKEFLQR